MKALLFDLDGVLVDVAGILSPGRHRDRPAFFGTGISIDAGSRPTRTGAA